ncbi:hypothetical protein SMALA_0345 [Streptomyces malaysiensis subsp. malaysiensis]|nr:hypothetical protein SMALA_0345 [Streptomyces malaysiensis]
MTLDVQRVMLGICQCYVCSRMPYSMR